jgi:UDP-N-acetylglucosamine 3-dehydrogenase
MPQPRVAVIGCGAIAQACHIPGYLAAGCELVAVADPRPGIADELRAAGLPVPTVYPDHRALLAAGPLDAVSICTPNSQHAPVFLDCAGRVPAILCEKPIALSLADADVMQAAATRHGTRVMVGFSHRFNPKVLAARTALLAGDIGRPHAARIRFAHTGPFPGWAKSNWFYRPELAGGGALLDMGIHAFDLVNWLLGVPRAVSARLATLRKPIAVDDNAVAVLEIGDDCLATIEVGWTSPAGFCGIELIGDAGALTVDYNAPAPVLVAGVRSPDGTSTMQRRELPVPAGEGWRDEMAYFAAGLGGQTAFTPDLIDGRRALAVALAAMASSRDGRRTAVTA